MREEGVLACRIGKHLPLLYMYHELVSGWNAPPRARGASSTVHDRFSAICLWDNLLIIALSEIALSRGLAPASVAQQG